MHRELDIAFDDEQHPVASVDFVYPVEPGDGELSELRAELERTKKELEDMRLARQEMFNRFVAFLGGNNTKPTHIGRRVILLSFLLGKSKCKTQRQLSKQLGVTEGRCSQILKIAEAEFSILTGIS